MTMALRFHRVLTWIGAFLEHATAIVIGLIMMVVGLGLGVTMIMLPVGLVIGFVGLALVVTGLFVRMEDIRHS